MLTIGEFSRICLASKKTLRYYDAIGLLRPEHTGENGYRYYLLNQLDDMRLIARLKSYCFSLPEIAAVLATGDRGMLQEKLMEKKKLLLQQQQQTSYILGLLNQDVEKLERNEDIMKKHIQIKTVERAPQTLFSVRKTIRAEDMGELFAALQQSIKEKKLCPTGAPMVFYHDTDFDRDHSDIEVAFPIDTPREGCRTLPGGLHCVTTVVGPYGAELYTPAYAGLMTWVEENGYCLCAPPFDVYVRGGGECPPEENVTEIYFPIAKPNQS